MTPKEVLNMAKENGAKMVDLKFIDLPGLWQHFSVPTSEVSESSLEDGYGFDGSSIRGWQAINLSDMLVIPDPNSANMDPFTEVPTLTMICDVLDPITRERYSRDPRYIAQKAEAFLRQTGLADTAYFGPDSSSLSSMTSATISMRTAGITSSTLSRGAGTAAVKRSPT